MRHNLLAGSLCGLGTGLGSACTGCARLELATVSNRKQLLLFPCSGVVSLALCHSRTLSLSPYVVHPLPGGGVTRVALSLSLSGGCRPLNPQKST